MNAAMDQTAIERLLVAAASFGDAHKHLWTDLKADMRQGAVADGAIDVAQRRYMTANRELVAAARAYAFATRRQRRSAVGGGA